MLANARNRALALDKSYLEEGADMGIHDDPTLRDYDPTQIMPTEMLPTQELGGPEIKTPGSSKLGNRGFEGIRGYPADSRRLTPPPQPMSDGPLDWVVVFRLALEGITEWNTQFATELTDSQMANLADWVTLRTHHIYQGNHIRSKQELNATIGELVERVGQMQQLLAEELQRGRIASVSANQVEPATDLDKELRLLLESEARRHSPKPVHRAMRALQEVAVINLKQGYGRLKEYYTWLDTPSDGPLDRKELARMAANLGTAAPIAFAVVHVMGI